MGRWWGVHPSLSLSGQFVGLQRPGVAEAAGVPGVATGGQVTEPSPLRCVTLQSLMQGITGLEEIGTIHRPR